MKTQSLRRTAGLIVLLAPLTLMPGSAAAAECEAEVDEALQELQVPESDVESVLIKKRRYGKHPQTNYDYNAWVRLRPCSSGYLVVHMTRYCYVEESYTRDDCQLDGVPHY